MVGGFLSAFSKKKPPKQIYLNDKFQTTLDDKVAPRFEALAGEQDGAFDAYRKELKDSDPRMRSEVEDLYNRDKSFYSSIANDKFDPFAAYKDLGDWSFGKLRGDMIEPLLGDISRSDKLRRAASGLGAGGESAYTSRLRDLATGDAYAKAAGSIFGSLPAAYSAAGNDRFRDILARVSAVQERSALPDRLEALIGRTTVRPHLEELGAFNEILNQAQGMNAANQGNLSGWLERKGTLERIGDGLTAAQNSALNTIGSLSSSFSNVAGSMGGMGGIMGGMGGGGGGGGFGGYGGAQPPPNPGYMMTPQMPQQAWQPSPAPYYPQAWSPQPMPYQQPAYTNQPFAPRPIYQGWQNPNGYT